MRGGVGGAAPAAGAARVAWDGAPRPPRRWQAEALPRVIGAVRGRKRVIVHAVMGSGKSVALSELCWLAEARLLPGDRIVVSTPSVALVEQLAGTIEARLGRGRVGRFYTHARNVAPPVIVACNDSLPDLAVEFIAADLRCRLWVADEAHKTECDDVKSAVAGLAPVSAVGFTATPFRSEPSETLSLWDCLAYSYSLGDALRDRVLVPWDVVGWDPDADDDARDADDVNGICLDLIQRRAPPGPGIVSARSIEDAEGYAELLTANGVPAEAIHSRMPRTARAALLERLRTGGLRCLVHVALLAEGVDLPWLRWLCLRRRVGARVRFAQEVGRVLRSEAPEDCPPGLAPKHRAVVLDPYDLFGVHGINHPEALGDPEPAPAAGTADEEEEFPLLDLPPKDVVLPRAVAVDAVGAWARRLLAVLELGGVYRPDGKWAADAAWRRSAVSDRQKQALGRMVWVKRHFPAEHRDALAGVCAHPEPLRQGIASDLLTALRAVADAAGPARAARTSWPWPAPPGLDLPALPDRVLAGLGVEAPRRRRPPRPSAAAAALAAGAVVLPFRRP